jgi:hypothetical protein
MASSQRLFERALCYGALAAAITAWTPTAQSRVTRIVLDTVTSPAFSGATFGNAGPYETIAGRAFGELDPNDAHNAIIQDISLAPLNANGKVEYTSTFFLVKPIDMSKSSRFMWHDVPNRGGRITISVFDRNNGDIGLSSGWQGDNSGATAQQPAPGNTNDYVVVPIAKNPDGSSITGPVLGTIINASGPNSSPLIVYANPVPYRPASLDATQTTIITHTSESVAGVVTGTATVPSTDWAWASCSATNPFPGTPDPTQICMKNGFNPALAYNVVFTAKDPYVLGIGFAAFRDVASFFKYETHDDNGTTNPLAGGISWSASRGTSQSGHFVRTFIHLGFNQDETNRKLHDASWPNVAGRHTLLNFRFAMPDSASLLYQPSAEGPMWWVNWPDTVRNRPINGLLDRCTVNNTCPKIIETFGATELWDLRWSGGLVGTSADADIPVTRNNRRYFIGSTPHAGGGGGFTVTPAAVPNGSGFNFGACTFPANPMPYTQTVNAITAHVRDWIISGIAPPPSRYPTLIGNNLVDDDRAAIGFPVLPAVLASAAPSAPTGFVNPILDYDFGPRFNYEDQSGIIDNVLPNILHVIKMKVAKTDVDGNDIGGVPVVLRDAPLGTYMGWNVTATGFHKGQICSFTGGMIPFAKTLSDRLVTGDPRLSLTERYVNHAGYVAAVTAAANNAMSQGFLLQADHDALIAAAAASNVLQ